jgi:magnesium-protoporphyrin O-methyltransferase
VFSHPPRNPVSRAVVATQNLLLRLGGRDFRVFAHPPAAMLAVLVGHGLRPAVAHRGPVWQITAATR